MVEQHSLERGKSKLQHRGEEERIAEDENPKKLRRVCNNGGKALGGQESTSQRSINGGAKKITPVCNCNVCGKAFQSWKSLYGHMRCHSRNRPRRGVDLLRHVAGWPITGKRGRGRSSIPAPEVEIMEAAQNLLWLANGPWISESNNTDLEEKKKQGRKKKAKLEIKDPISVFGYPDLSTRPVNQPGPVGGFHCVTCSKEFSTYQALGGHRSKHYKERIHGVQSFFCNPGPAPQNGSTWAQLFC